MTMRVWGRVGVAFGLAALVATACKSEHYVDASEFCAERPTDAECAGGAGGGAGGGGNGLGGNGGGPSMGAGGVGGAGGGGGGLACTGTTVDCGGACVDLTKDDAANCGACGRSCLGAAICSAGACVPEAMATGEVAPYALAQDATHLYWVSPAINGSVNDARMRRVSKESAGASAENVLDGVRVRARSLSFAGGKLYWGDLGASPTDFVNHRLLVASPNDAGPQIVESAQLNVQYVAFAGAKIYWTAANDAAMRGKGIGGAGGGLAPNVPSQTNPGWLSVDDDEVPYWVAGVPAEVRRLAASTPNTHESVPASANATAVGLAGDRFYWTDATALRSAPKATPAMGRQELGGLGKIEGFAVVSEGAGGAGGAGGGAGAGGASGDATLYVVTSEGQRLKIWRKGPSGDPFLLGQVDAKSATYDGNPFGAAYVSVDAQYVYFADVGTVDTAPDVDTSQGDGVIYRVAR